MWKKTTDEAKGQIRTSADYLADLCLENAEAYHQYDDKDLVNATAIFAHFLMDILYTTNLDLPLNKKMELAETTGLAIRELILASTGKDMHQLVKSGLEANGRPN